MNDKFFGYSTPTCSARVFEDTTSICLRDFKTKFALKGVVIRRSPEADEGVKDASGVDLFCLGSDQGKKGIYEFANCVKP